MASRATRSPAGAVDWSTGQPAASADAVLWAIGRVQPNTSWLPRELLDDSGFVRVTPELRVPGHRGVFAAGDVAATDPLRSSARNRGDALVARNVRAELAGGAGHLPRARPPVGLGPGHPARWVGGLPAHRPGVPLAVMAGRTAGDAVDRAPGHVRRSAGKQPAALTVNRVCRAPTERADVLDPHAGEAVVFPGCRRPRPRRRRGLLRWAAPATRRAADQGGDHHRQSPTRS